MSERALNFERPAMQQEIPPAPLRLADEFEFAPLPTQATGSDVRELVKYLKNKPTGITIVQALNSEQRRLFDERKIAAYKFWGLLEQRQERLRLTPFGYEFARQLRPEARMFRALLRRIEPYRKALAWVYAEELDLVPFDAIAALWQQQHPTAADLREPKTVERYVICFFHLCQAADLGVVTIGKRGQPARMRVIRDELAAFTTTALQTESPPAVEAAAAMDVGAETPPPNGHSAAPRLSVFISHRRGPQLARQAQEVLRLMDVQSFVSERGVGAKQLMPTQTLSTMRRCRAALVLIGEEDCRADGAGHYTLDEQLRLEVNVAHALFERAVILLWAGRAPLPAELQTFRHCRTVDDGLSWESGLQLMKLIKEFRASL